MPEDSEQESRAQCQSQEYDLDNLLDRLTPQERLDHYDRYCLSREAELMKRHGLGPLFESSSRSRVLSVGCGCNPRRGLPEGNYYLVGLDSDPRLAEAARESGTADQVQLGVAARLPFAKDEFDVVVFRLVLHHLAYQGPLRPAILEAARVLRPGGAVVIVEPGLFHPVGMLLALFNRLGFSKRIKGTVDDCPLSPFRLRNVLSECGLKSQVYGIEYSWRRLPVLLQRLAEMVSFCGTLPVLKCLAHTFMVVGEKTR